jgi:protoheme ferro-lyase
MLRQRYLKIGRSNHRSEHFRMLASLTDLYLSEGRTDLRFYICFLDDDPRPEAAVIKALNSGASRIIVANVFLTISNHTSEGRKRIDMIGCYENYGVKVSYTEPLWDSETLMKAFSEKIYERIGETDKSKVAVALIGHGQPDEWDREWPTLTEQETSFRNCIIEMLHREGFRKECLGNAWLMFKKPEPVSLMRKFIENGAEKILYFASSISSDAIPSQSEIPDLVNKYVFPPGTELINMGAWNDHPMVIKAIKEKIDLKLVEN